MERPAIHELNSDYESTGAVHWFCSFECLCEWEDESPRNYPLAYVEDRNYVAGAVCEQCGKPLDEEDAYEQAIAERELAEAEAKAAGAALQAFPKLANGLTPDEVKFSPAYRKARARFDAAFAAVRRVNAYIVANFKKEERARRRSRQ